MSTGLAARLAERSRAARRLVLRRLALAVMLLGLLGALAWVLFASPLLALDEEKVEVAGLSELVEESAVRAAVAPEAGIPLLRVDTAAVAERVRDLEAVADAHVSRSWPDGLTVTVVPREPVAVSPEEGAGWVLVDEEGVQLAVREEPPEELPRVTVPLGDSGETGPALGAVLTVLGELPGELRERVDRAGATSPDHITLVLAGGARVRWGNAEDSEFKAEVLLVLLQREATEYDVSVPRNPTTSGEPG